MSIDVSVQQWCSNYDRTRNNMAMKGIKSHPIISESKWHNMNIIALLYMCNRHGKFEFIFSHFFIGRYYLVRSLQSFTAYKIKLWRWHFRFDWYSKHDFIEWRGWIKISKTTGGYQNIWCLYEKRRNERKNIKMELNRLVLCVCVFVHSLRFIK